MYRRKISCKLQCKVLKMTTERVEYVYANNEYVELEDLNPDDFEDNGWVNSIYIENITAKF